MSLKGSSAALPPGMVAGVLPNDSQYSIWFPKSDEQAHLNVMVSNVPSAACPSDLLYSDRLLTGCFQFRLKKRELSSRASVAESTRYGSAESAALCVLPKRNMLTIRLIGFYES